MTLIGPAIKIAQLVYKNRQTIYKVLIAQDKAIGGAYRKGGYGKATSYGVRSGAAAGSLIGSLITNIADDTPGNAIQTPFSKQPITTRKPYKTRKRFSMVNKFECGPRRNTRYSQRRSSYR